MIAGLKPYAEYNDSGLPWLGEVPSHWEVRRVKTVLREVDRRSAAGREPLLSLRMQAGLVDHHASGGRPIPPSALVGYKRVLPGEIVMNRMRASSGLFAAATTDGLVSPDYAIFRSIGQINVAYVVELFRTPAMKAVFRLESTGLGTGESGFLRLYSDQFGRLAIPTPPAAEQAAIVRFLDWANGRLERAIRAKRKVIALLMEQKQVIIHTAITRGLDRDGPTKQSGVSWLGEIPDHWEVTAVGAATTLIQTGPFGSQLHSHEYVHNGTPVINPSHMLAGRLNPSADIAIGPEKAKELVRHQLRESDIVIARRGELGRCALVFAREEGWICGTGSLLLRCNVTVLMPQFFQLVFSSSGIANMLSAASVGATMANLNAGMVARQRLPVPPLDEQAEVVRYVASETQRIELAASHLRREIELLREYRTRLVAEVVTGKLDVREAAATLPEDATAGIEAEPADETDDPELIDEEATEA